MSKTLVSIFPALLLASGCLSPVTAGISAEGGRVSIENEEFGSRVRLVEDRTVFIGGGFLKAQVTLHNNEKRDVSAQYKFIWIDKNGLTMKSAETVWNHLSLHGREEMVIEAVCPVHGAADFRFVLRPM